MITLSMSRNLFGGLRSQKLSNPLIVIVGPTASGKSSLAMSFAKEFDGEIIAADSRTVYCHMDIGTAKPTKKDQREVKHHLIDVVEPDQRYSAAEFKEDAEDAIEEIGSRGKLPIMVGGTGLYIDSILYNYSFAGDTDIELRQRLSELGLAELQSRVNDLGVKLNNSDFNNPHRLIRAIETSGTRRNKSPLREKTLVIGIQIDRVELIERIKNRAGKMFEEGLEAEIAYLLANYSKEAPGLSDGAYQALFALQEGSITKSNAINAVIKSHADLAKRQMTWFKRNHDIHWISNEEEATSLVTNFLERL